MMTTRPNIDARVAEEARRGFADTKYNWLRPQRRRRLLVVLTAALWGLYTGTLLVPLPFIRIAALLSFFVALIGLRVATRRVTELPDEVVDERMRSERGSVYRAAFIGTFGLLSAAWVAAIVLVLTSPDRGTTSITLSLAIDLLIAFGFAMLALPSGIYAWVAPDEEAL